MGKVSTVNPDAWRELIRSVPDYPKPGIDFKDITPLLADANAFGNVVEAIANAFAPSDVDVVCGIEARGFILAAPVAHRLGTGFVPIRKLGKLPSASEAASYVLEYSEAVLEIHSDALSAGQKVLLVDDVLATGGTAKAAIELVERLGARVLGLAFLIELEFLNGASKLQGYDHLSLITYSAGRSPRTGIRVTMAAMDRPAIAVYGLIKKYGSLEALSGIDFEVPEGTIFGLLGPNGAGKTTVIRILSTIVKADGGRAEVLGYDVSRNAAAVRHVIGLAGQSAAVDPNLTGRENLRLIGKLAQLPAKYSKARATELLERFDLVAAGDRPIKTYSGGMRRRLDVAAALVSKPPVIFLDEPTTGLDIQSRTELWAVIRELVAEGSTVLLTTQYLEEADQLADRIAVISAGKVVANDTAATLKSQLGASVIEVTLDSESGAARTQALLEHLVVSAPEREGSKVRLSTPDGPAVLTQVLRALDANRVHAAGITVREPSLDDVFLSLTGKHVAPAQPLVKRRRKRQAPNVEDFEVAAQPTEEPEPADPQEARAMGHEDSSERAGAGADLAQMLSRLVYRAGSGTVTDNLVEIARVAQSHYRVPGIAHVELTPLSGYFALEQRFGRISPNIVPEQAAALLLGAAIASGSGLTRDVRGNGQSDDFAASAVRILLEGIAEMSTPE